MINDNLPFNAARISLLTEPTPLRRLERLGKQIGHDDLFIKRDDHMEIALGGNKVRSLEFWLGAAKQEKADIVLVAGGAMSNLCRLSAAAAAMQGLACIIFHNTQDCIEMRRQSFLNQILGAEVRFLGPMSEDERTQAVMRAAETLKEQGRRPYIIGDESVGALGYSVAAYELYQQKADLRHIFLAGSMGPTEAGFIFGNALLGNPFDIHLISVEYTQAELTRRIGVIYEGLKALTGLSVPDVEKLPVHYHMDYLGEGYGKATDQAERALLMLARLEGIFTEYVYTAKTLAGFIDLVERGKIPVGEASCFLHTGGVASLFSQFDLFRSLPVQL